MSISAFYFIEAFILFYFISHETIPLGLLSAIITDRQQYRNNCLSDAYTERHHSFITNTLIISSESHSNSYQVLLTNLFTRLPQPAGF